MVKKFLNWLKYGQIITREWGLNSNQFDFTYIAEYIYILAILVISKWKWLGQMFNINIYFFSQTTNKSHALFNYMASEEMIAFATSKLSEYGL